MKCDNCEKSISFWDKYGNAGTVLCKECYESGEFESKNEQVDINEQYSEEIRKIILTTESHLSNIEVTSRLGIVTSECVIGMNIFRDIFAEVRDIFGGRSKASQKILTKLKDTALLELKNRAFDLGADAVIAVDLDYNEFSGGGKSMLFLVASGTAIKLNTG